MKSLRSKVAILALLCSAASTQAIAQSAPAQPQEPTAPADQEQAGLNEILVVAQKRVERLGDVPVSVGVVQGESLDRLNLTKFEELSHYIPGFNVATTASGNRITLRGISSGTNRGFEQSVGLFVDGIYAGRAAQFSSPFFDVERIEVLKGPQSILFGKNTVAGAVSVITAKPTKNFEAIISGGYEFRFKGFDGSAIVNAPLTDNLQVRLAYRHDERDHGFLFNTLANEHEPSRQNDLARVSLAWQPGGGVEVNAKYEYSRSEQVGSLFQIFEPGRFGPLFTQFDPRFESKLNLQNSVGGPGSDRNPITAHNVALRVSVPIGSGNLTSDTGYSTYIARTLNEDSDMTPVQVIRFNNKDKYSQFSQELRYASPADDPIAYTIGAFYQSGHFVGKPEFIFTATALGLFDTDSRRVFDQHDDTYSAFGEVGVRLAEGLRMIGGLRYIVQNKDVDRQLTVIDLATGLPETNAAKLARVQAVLGTKNFAVSQSLRERQLTPAVTLQYKINPDAMAYAKFSRGFKSGGFDASDTSGDAAPYRSESVSAYEAGFKWTASRQFNLNVAAFYSKFDDLQVQAFNGLSFITTNAAKASSRGVEVEAQWRPVRTLTLAGSVSYLDAKFDRFTGAACTTAQTAAFPGPGRCTQDLSGRPQTDAPHWSASFNATHEFAVSGDWHLRSNLGANLRSSAFVAPDLDPLALQKGYTTVDAAIELIAPSDRFSIGLLAKNIGDVRAKTFVVNAPLFSGAKAASIIDPRTVELRAAVRF